MSGLTLRAEVNGLPADGSQILMPITISQGRSGVDAQADAPQANLTWLSTYTAPTFGDRIDLIVSLPTPGDAPAYDSTVVMYDDPTATYDGSWLTELPRFSGTVTDVITQEQSGLPGLVQIVAISPQAELGRVTVQLSRPSEDDISRVTAIAAAAGVGIEIHGNPGPLLAPAELNTDALAAIQEMCNSSAGLLWSDTSGVLHYGTGDHRTLTHPMAVIPAHVIISGLEWKATLADLINKVIVSWATGQSTLTDDISISVYGVREESVSTTLVDQAAADQLGVVILARRAWPFAQITDVLLDSAFITDTAALYAAIRLRVSDALLLPIPPDPGPTGLLAEWIAEGWQEEWLARDHVTIQFAVSDRARFAQTTLRTWGHAETNTWEAELARGAWLDTLILNPGEA